MWWLAGIYLVSERAELLDAKTILDESAIDKYVARRDFYYQRRRDLIYDGNPPRPPREPPPGREEPRSEAAPATQAIAATSAPDARPRLLMLREASDDDGAPAPQFDSF